VTSSVVALINCAGAAEIVMAGADVPVSRFERRLLGAWGGRGVEVTIIDNQGRVVMSNCAHALSGDLLSDPDRSTVRVDLPDVPWHVRVVDRPGGLPIPHG